MSFSRYSSLLSAVLSFLLLAVLSLPHCLAAEETITIPNGGFEEGLSGWSVNETEPISTVGEAPDSPGCHALRILDESTSRGSWIVSEKVTCAGPAVVDIRGRLFPVSGSGLGIYVRQYASDGKCISGESHIAGLGGSEKKWLDFSRRVYLLDHTVAMDLLIHSYSAATVEAWLDDLHFVRVATVAQPPWEGQYRIRPDETARLTEADVVGPDGIVYPDWTRCGLPDGIPTVTERIELSSFGGVPDDDRDDADALDRAVRRAAAMGGACVVLSAGTYHLDRPVTVRGDGVVIRGAGMDSTRIVFRYALPAGGICFYTPSAGAAVDAGTPVEVHAAPTGLTQVELSVNGTVFHTWTRGVHSGNTFAIRRTLGKAVKQCPPGEAELLARVTYGDGEVREVRLPVHISETSVEPAEVASSGAAVTFLGNGKIGPRYLFAEDGRRGSRKIVLDKQPEELSPGDSVFIEAPATARWKMLTQNACRWGSYRCYAARIVSIRDTEVILDQPLRLDFPTIDGSFLQKLSPISRCGIEDLTIEQTENLWISSVMFRYGWECWARGVKVVKCGRFPVYGSAAKCCEIRDCVFEDAWFKGGGGTAYAGWEYSWDCLIDNLTTFRLRHAPCFQWAASGCVIRNSTFHDSDAQWHSGWTNENLMENCVVISIRGNGGYGFGMWASPPEDTAHGPNGPRNVVYRCDISSEKTGLWMGGMNENWIIVYNRFHVREGDGVLAKTASFDHIIRGNVFSLDSSTATMVRLMTPDCIGIELTDNILAGGSGTFAEGLGASSAVLSGNRSVEYSPETLPVRPVPPVASIFAWQRARPGGN